MEYPLDFYTDYNQFYISSDGGQGLSDHPRGLFSSDNGRLIQLKNLLIVCTESYGHIHGKFFKLSEKEENIDLTQYDHIVECGLDVQSGIIQILDCPHTAVEFEINVMPGTYMVRVYFSNMQGYDSDDYEGKENYIIEVSPSERMEKRILKAFKK